MRAAMHDLADLARPDVTQIVIDDARLDVNAGTPTRARLAQLFVRWQQRGQRRDLGLAVHVQNRRRADDGPAL